MLNYNKIRPIIPATRHDTPKRRTSICSASTPDFAGEVEAVEALVVDAVDVDLVPLAFVAVAVLPPRFVVTDPPGAV